MIRTLAIDDEPLALQQLAAYIKKIPYLELVGECQSAIDAHTLMQKEPVDAIFCDISMPDLNGLDFVRALNPPRWSSSPPPTASMPSRATRSMRTTIFSSPSASKSFSRLPSVSTDSMTCSTRRKQLPPVRRR